MKHHNCIRRQLVQLLLMVLLPVALVFPAKATGGAAVSIPVSQEIIGEGKTADAVRSYILVPVDAANPMPDGGGRDGYLFRLSGNASAEIGPITFDWTGDYWYTVSPADEISDGMQPSGYRVLIRVDGDGTAQVAAYLPNGSKSEITFEGTIPEQPTPPEEPDEPIKPDQESKPGRPERPEHPSMSRTPKTPKTPKTGDTSFIGEYAGLAILAFCGIIAVTREHQRRKNG